MMPLRKHRQSGQTLIIALIVLGVLLVLGFVFTAILSRNINQTKTSTERTQVSGLAEAGVRYAHSQMLTSSLGADWKPVPTPPSSNRDPDFDLLQTSGPDGLGAYSRVPFEGGRALIRVRYAPSDPDIFNTNRPAGTLRQPGKARAYLSIESFGRKGNVNPNDPTTTLNRDRRESRKLIAYVPIGIIDAGRFITNKFNVSRPAEIGMPDDTGVQYEGTQVMVPSVMGNLAQVYNLGPAPTPAINPMAFGGSLICNADLLVHGRVVAFLNATLGDAVRVAGTIRGATDAAVLSVTRASWNAGWNQTTTNLTNTTNPSLNSNSSVFSTILGVIRDGSVDPDSEGYTRSAGRLEPPSIQSTDPSSGLNRVYTITRDSGQLLAAGNSGRFGHGRGIYVNNTQDRQIRSTEDGREEVGSQESLMYDWLNPNNGQANSGWVGPYYIPRGAYLELTRDGFIIIRDGKATGNQRTWRNPNGADTLSTQIRYRIGDVAGEPYIINTYTPGIDINSANPNFAAGLPFNGTVLFEGNVRVRGTIPTDRQLTVMSMATIYIEGSITKGIVDDSGNRLNRPSRSALMLIAKDNVALNTSQFVGPAVRQALTEDVESATNTAYNAVMMDSPSGSINLRFDLLLDPNTNGGSPTNPTTWQPYATQYTSFNTMNRIDPRMVMTHAMDDGPQPATMFSLDVNYGITGSTYLFGTGPLAPHNAASPFYPAGYITPGYSVPNFVPVYGLGIEAWQQYPKFETIGFPLVNNSVGGSYSILGNTITMGANNPTGSYRLLANELNDLSLRHNNVGFPATSNYLLSRAAIIPADVRIEAAIYAEDGSFFVIPGPWFNPNPNDRRDTYAGLGATPAERATARQETYGSFTPAPFYGEPIDVKVTIVGAVSENMPPPMSQQAEWLKKWGWIPREIGATGQLIPGSHVPSGFDLATDRYVPNLTIEYDPALATGRVLGFDLSAANQMIRTDAYGRQLPPMPRLPVSPTLSYFGEQR